MGESPLEAAKRESWEEACIAEELPCIQLQARALIPATCFPDLADTDVENLVEYSFAVQVAPNTVKLSCEHNGLRWLGFEEAMQILKWESNKDALRELHATLT